MLTLTFFKLLIAFWLAGGLPCKEHSNFIIKKSIIVWQIIIHKSIATIIKNSINSPKLFKIPGIETELTNGIQLIVEGRKIKVSYSLRIFITFFSGLKFFE